MLPLAVSTGIQIAYVIGLVVLLFLGPVTIAELKGNSILVGEALLRPRQTCPGKSPLGRRRIGLARAPADGDRRPPHRGQTALRASAPAA